MRKALTVKGALHRATWDNHSPAIIGDIKKLHGFGDQLFDGERLYSLDPADIARNYIDADVDAISMVVGHAPFDYTLRDLARVGRVIEVAGRELDLPLIAKVRHRLQAAWSCYVDCGALAVLLFPRADDDDEIYATCESIYGAEQVGLEVLAEVHGWNAYRIFTHEYGYEPIVINRRNHATGEIDEGAWERLVPEGWKEPYCVTPTDVIQASGFTEPEEVADAFIQDHPTNGVMVGTHFMKNPGRVKQWVHDARELSAARRIHQGITPKQISWAEHMEELEGLFFSITDRSGRTLTLNPPVPAA